MNTTSHRSVVPFTRDEARLRRDTLMGETFAPEKQGLEIGPRDSPMVLKSEGAVRYVDYVDTEGLLASLPPSANPAAVMPVDIVWGDQPLREAAGGPGKSEVGESQLECGRAVFLDRPYLRLESRSEQLSMATLSYFAARHAGYFTYLQR